MKIRISRDLHARAWACADALGEKKLTRFIDLAVINDAKGRLDDVVVDEGMMVATRENSTVVTFLGDDKGWHCDRVKLALVRAVLFAEAANPPPFVPDGIEGKDFVIAN